MSLTKLYFMCSIGLGLYFASHLVAMLAHADHTWNNYILALAALAWVPISLVATIGFLKKPLFCISPVSYVVYFALNYFTSPQNSFSAEFDVWGIASVVFGLLYVVLNVTFLAQHFKSDERVPASAGKG